MSQIIQQGSLNATALVVPDVYVQILAPNVANLNGVPTNVVGVVGIASWGPVGSPLTIANAGNVVARLGPITNRASDLATACSVLIQNGCNNIRTVRVTDGTDTAATGTLMDTAGTPAIGAHLTAFYTGILGNSVSATLQVGTKAATFRLIVQIPGQNPEVFDNIPGTGAAFWQNLVNAVNNGNSATRGPSKYVVASIGVSSAAPAIATVTLTSGTDGTSSITTAVLVGTDGGIGARRGLYGLRGTGTSVATIADLSDPTSFAAQVAYGLSEGTYMVGAGAPGQSPTTGTAALATAGAASYAFKMLLGDWCYWLDTTNGGTRMLSPATFYAGMLGNQAPQYSGLNKPIFGIIGTQSSLANYQYSAADIQTLVQGNVDVICNPVPGGNYFGARVGHNTSGDNGMWGDNYTRMTNYLSQTLAAGMGQFIGYLQSGQSNDATRAMVKATIDSFLQNMVQQGQIDSFSTICDLTNNSPSQIALGYLQVNVQVKYLAVVEKLLVNMMGGQSVQVTRLSTTQIQSTT